MPVNREPHIYPGYVISQISKNAGEKEDMPYHVAQQCVVSGTHRWADDETDLPNHVQDLITTRETDQEALDKANAEHNAKLRAERKATENAATVGAGKPISFITVGDKTYLARPFPSTAIFELGVEHTDGVITVTAENGLADYKIVSGGGVGDDARIIAELLSEQLPDVDIPDDWRDKKALQLTAMAKKIRGTSDKMSGDEAKAILEEWTKQDDPVSVDPSDGEGKEIPDAENRNKSDVPETDAAGKPLLSPEERAQQAAREGIDKDEDDFF